jgi:hypothetical protein
MTVDRSGIYSMAPPDFSKVIRWLVPAGFAVADALAIKTVVDLWPYRAKFPAPFVPVFALGMGVLTVLSAYMIWSLGRASGSATPRSGIVAYVIWGLLAFSFVAVSAVHAFCPFRPDVMRIMEWVSPVLRLNYAIAAAGLLTTIALGVLYLSGQPQGALVGLLISGLLWLVPNDDCRNAFNLWWLEVVGASPLMYVPNLYAILFGASGLLGVHTGLNLVLVVGIVVGALLLGIGHQMRILW